MAKLRVLIFDEADQLLDQGFRPAITQMLGMLPPKDTRQCLLFSATMPNDVVGMAKLADARDAPSEGHTAVLAVLRDNAERRCWHGQARRCSGCSLRRTHGSACCSPRQCRTTLLAWPSS